MVFTRRRLEEYLPWSTHAVREAPRARRRLWTLSAGSALGAPFDVWVVPGERVDPSDPSWRDGSYAGAWYVNLQEPLRRTDTGFDTMDHVLDVVVARDLSAWSYKDEAEFARAVELGVFAPAEAAQIRADAEHVVGLIRDGNPPWNRGWADATEP